MSDKKILAQGSVPNPGIGILYECPFNYTAQVTLIKVTDESSDYTIEVKKATNSLTNGTTLFKFFLDQGDVHMNDNVVNLVAGEKILGVSNKNTTEFVIEGTEISTTP